MLIMFLYWAN